MDDEEEIVTPYQDDYNENDNENDMNDYQDSSSQTIIRNRYEKDEQVQRQDRSNRPDLSNYLRKQQLHHHTQRSIPTSQKPTNLPTTRVPTREAPTTKSDYSKYTPVLLALAAIPAIIFGI